MLGAALRSAGKWALGATCATAALGVSALQFDRFENRYWHKRDPWRSRREDEPLLADERSSSNNTAATPHTAAESEAANHYGWGVEEEPGEHKGTPLLGPAAPGGRPRVVVLGTGWGARYFLETIDRDAYEVRVVSPRNFFLFTPLLPSTSTGTISPSSVCSPVREMISYKTDPLYRRLWYMLRGHLPAEVKYYPAEATAVDFDRKVVRCQSNEGNFGLTYDKLVIAVGSTINTFGTQGVEKHCLFMKEVGDGIITRNKIFEQFEKATLPLAGSAAEIDAERERLLHFVVVGGGPTGVEVAAELQDLITEDLISSGGEGTSGHTLYKNALARVKGGGAVQARAKVTLIQSGEYLLNAYHENVSKIAANTMRDAGVNLLLSHRVKAVEEDSVVVLDKTTKQTKRIACGLTVWATGVGSRPLTKDLVTQLANQGAKQMNRRAITTSDRLQVIGPCGPDQSGGQQAADGVWSAEDGRFHWNVVDGVYAIGDCATISQHSLLEDLDKLWNMADINGDGLLDKNEIELLFQRFNLRLPDGVDRRLASKGQQLATMFGSSDGTLTREDFRRMLDHINICHRSLPPTAQVAKMQGIYVAQQLNNKARAPILGANAGPFKFTSSGQMAYVGKNVSVAGFGADGSFVMGDAHITNLVWRAVYWSMLADGRSMAAVPLGWAYAAVFGRDSSCVADHLPREKPSSRA